METEQLKKQLALMTDEALLARVENKSEEFTPEALSIIDAEIARRGGLEALKRKVEESRHSRGSAPDESLRLLKRAYPAIVLIAYGAFMYAIRASLWFYWLCLFLLVASLFALLFKPPFNPEDEIKELSAGTAGGAGSTPPIPEPGDEGDFGTPL